MKKHVLIALVATICVACGRGKTVEVALTMHDGYGNFSTGMRGLTPQTDDPASPWYKTNPTITRLPGGLTGVEVGNIETNIYQAVYQDYHAGNITREWYEELQKEWSWTPDTTALSKVPVRTKIAFAWGVDAAGERRFVLDANGNLDLSDDVQFVPVNSDDFHKVDNKDSLALAHAVRVTVETFVHGRVEQVETPVVVAYAAEWDMYLSNIVCHATGEYKGQPIAVASYDNLNFDNCKIALPSSEEEFCKDEYVEIAGELLKIVGVNTNKNVLILERAEGSKSQLFSTQIGFMAPLFEGEEFTTGEALSLEGLRGKYVLLDFWGTWCGPCMSELPALRRLYEETDRERFEIVGIACLSRPGDLTDAIATHGIAWPQILSDEIKDMYGIRGYPTTILIDPAGVVVAKYLRGEELAERVRDLVGEW